jgi:hypothetical protein
MTGKVDALYRALLAREEEWQNRTTEIFAGAEYVTTGIINYLNQAVEVITWESIDVIGNEMLIQVSIPNDDRFQYVEPGESSIQTLTIVLPTSVIEVEDSELITQFLHDTEDVRKHDHRGYDEDSSEDQGVVGYSIATKRTLH